MKYTFILIIILLTVLLFGCTKIMKKEIEKHATEENVAQCFEDHVNEPYEDVLVHCKEEICGLDEHCFEEVEELAQEYSQ